MKYNDIQLRGARRSAQLNGHPAPNESQCIEFLDWYHNHKTEYASVEEARRAGLMGLVTNGVRQQEVEWARIFSA